MQAMKLLLATTNRGKVIEISEALSSLNLEIVSLADVGMMSSAPETGETYADNALQKARWAYEQAQIPTLADDSGIIIDALQGELGVHTRRWGAGPDASDEEWINYFLDRMNVETNKAARFVCVLAYIDSEGTEHVFEGACEGVITPGLEADYLPGLPLSACFRPDCYDCVFSALNPEQKNETSHRGRAVKQFSSYVASTIDGL